MKSRDISILISILSASPIFPTACYARNEFGDWVSWNLACSMRRLEANEILRTVDCVVVNNVRESVMTFVKIAR